MGEPRYTEKEMVMAKRKAFVLGSTFENHAWQKSMNVDYCSGADSIAESRSRYPLPKVERPRVVTDALNCQWKFSERRFQVRCRADSVWGEWQAAGYSWRPSPDLVLLWADLIAHPSEFVDDEG